MNIASLDDLSLTDIDDIVIEEVENSDEKFPVKTLIDQKTFGELVVDLVIIDFPDKLQVSLTTIGSPGSFFEITAHSNPAALPGSQDSKTYEIKTLLGIEPENYRLLARSVAGVVDSSRPVVVTVGIKNLQKSNLRDLITFVESKYKEFTSTPTSSTD